tara:strand:- start:157 stop:390 length:234 start_codon:yes stop_codon:yes gene_type:complete
MVHLELATTVANRVISMVLVVVEPEPWVLTVATALLVAVPGGTAAMVCKFLLRVLLCITAAAEPESLMAWAEKALAV